MAKYEKHPRQKGKYQCTVCDYGHSVGKSRQAVTNHYNKVHKEGDSSTINISSSSDIDESKESKINSFPISETPPPLEEQEGQEPAWLNFETTDSSEEVSHESLPLVANTVLSHWNKSGGFPQTKENLAQFYQQQAKMMRWFFNGIVDPFVSWYGKSITSNAKFEIKRNESEWQLFEGISQQWLEYRQIVLPVTPDIMMAGCIGSFYVPQIYKIQKNKDKSKSFSPLSIFRRWRLRKKMKAEIKRNPLNENRDETPHA
tara:strand:+ start:1664 stop:2437 length:774 start_codon:yes stop_codon:yes gene_type:complete